MFLSFVHFTGCLYTVYLHKYCHCVHHAEFSFASRSSRQSLFNGSHHAYTDAGTPHHFQQEASHLHVARHPTSIHNYTACTVKW